MTGPCTVVPISVPRMFQLDCGIGLCKSHQMFDKFILPPLVFFLWVEATLAIQ